MSAEGTRRQHVEAALSESELRFQAIFAQAAVGIAQIGLDGAWLLVNNRFCQMLGYSEAELCTKALEDITHPDYIEESRAGRRRLLAGEISSHTMEKRYIRKDGTIFWGRLNRSLVRDHDNRPRYLIAVVEDMTERIEAERALRVSEQRLALAQNAGHVGVWDCDLRTNITVISPEYAKLHGLGPDHPPLTHQEWLELVHPDDRERVQALLRESLVHPHSWDTEFRVVWPDGSVHWLLGKGKVFLDDCGLPVRMAGVSLEITDRKQAEAALRESEERFRNMADTAPVMIWVSGTDKLCTFFNKPWLDFTGRTMEQELRNGWAEGVHPEDLDRCLATYNSSFDARRSFRMEYRIQRADGEYRWVLDNGTPHYRDGEFMGFIGSCIDVTEQKLMANRLHGQTVQLKDAQRLAKLGSWERDLKNGSIDWSEETLRIFNVSSLPSTLPDFLKHVHPNDREKVLKAAEEVQSSISPIELPYRIIRPDGEVRFVRAIVETIRDDQGVAVRTIGAYQDITEQVKAEQLLRESEKLLKNAERLAQLGYWHLDLKTNQVIGSEECFRIFGRSPNYTLSLEGILQALVPEDRERVERETGHRLAEKKGGAIEFRIVRPDGDLRTIRSISELLLDEEGQPASFFGACQDITEERRAQEETVARQKLESIGTLASGIAHDFNNLLAGVLAQTELALSELSAGVNPEQELKAILDVAIRGSEIVRELMIYAGKESAVVGLVDVSRIVKEMLELLKVSVSKHAEVETDLDEDLPAVRANAAQLRQVVMNLVTNASEAIGDRDGVIRVTTSCVKVDKDSSEGISDRLAAGDYVQLTVSDTGRGMPRETQVRVFDPFFTTKAVGHGLGLSIVHGIVTGLGGAIHLTSEPDKGTTFQILLPWAEGTAETFNGPMPASEEPARPAQSATILVVEDEDALRKAVGRMLRKIGFEVLEAANGSAAIDLLRTSGGKIDVVLLDLTVPGASSSEVVAAAAKARPDLKVVLTSAYSEEMATPTWSTPLIHGFIRKPYQFGDLAQTLRDALPS